MIVDRYEGGVTSSALAADDGVVMSKTLGILRTNTVVFRRQLLAAKQVSEAARLYESGQSLSQVAAQRKVIRETMRAAILDSWAVLREPTRAKYT